MSKRKRPHPECTLSTNPADWAQSVACATVVLAMSVQDLTAEDMRHTAEVLARCTDDERAVMFQLSGRIERLIREARAEGTTR